MRLNSYIFITLLCVLFTACGVSCAFSAREKPKPAKVQVHEPVQIADIGMQTNREYVVREKIDLKGKQVNVPAGVTITFKRGGAIVNGTLNGNGTKLNSKLENVLGVKLKGSWCVDKVSDLVFSKEHLSDTEIINNLNVIQSDAMANEVTIVRDYNIAIAKSGGAGLVPSSHSTVLLKGTISLEGNDFPIYKIVYINNKEDVTVEGGKIVGDVGRHTYIEGSSSEWGMGIYIMQSKDITLSDIYISKCTGDGIYVTGDKETAIGVYDNASKNISIYGITCDANRRQGLSIIHVDGLHVKDCSFVNTGQIEYTAPGAGIDIEPNVSNNRNMSVRNIIVENCRIKNNKGMAVANSTTYEKDGKKTHEKILYYNCQTDGLLKCSSDDITFRKCSFKEARLASAFTPTRICFEDCSIAGGYGLIFYTSPKVSPETKDKLLNVLFKNCYLATIESNTETESMIYCHRSSIPNLQSISFDNCRIEIPRMKDRAYKLINTGMVNKLKISKSEIIMSGRSFESQGVLLNGNVIRCRRALKVSPQSTNTIITE